MMQNDNEPNTLAGHNLQVGDVVKMLSDPPREIDRISADGKLFDRHGRGFSAEYPFWIVISRAKPKPKNETQFGDWEIWNGKGEPPTGLVQVHCRNETREVAEACDPMSSDIFIWEKIIAFRRVIEPVRGEVVMTGHLKHFNAGGQMSNDTHSVTLPTIDGKLVTGDAVPCKIEVLT